MKKFKIRWKIAKQFEKSKCKINVKKSFFISLCFILSVVYSGFFSLSFASDISATSAIVVDSSTGKILFAKNSHRKQPVASTVKLMTAIIAVERADLDKTITINKKISLNHGTKISLKKGDKMRLEDLLYAALMESSNDAAKTLAEAVAGSEWKFVKLMNQEAQKIGALNTHYKNSSGLPVRGQYSTVSDLVKTMQYAIKIPIIREILSTRVKKISTFGGEDIFLKNTNKFLWKSDPLICGKTGFTRRAGHCFVGFTDVGDSEIIVAILGARNRETLWSEGNLLFEKGFQAVVSQKGATKDSKDIRISGKDSIREEITNIVNKVKEGDI